MIKIDRYYYRDEEAPKIIVSADWFIYEDRWHQRYLFDHPRYAEDEMQKKKLLNENRHRKFRISLNIFHYHIMIDFKLKKIGNIYHGRPMEDGPRPSPRKRKQK